MFGGGGSIPAEIVSVQASSSPSQAVVVHMGVSSASGGVHLTRRGCFPAGRHRPVYVVRLPVVPRADDKDDRGGPR